MADPKLEGSKQPYHAAEGLDLKEAQRLLKRYSDSAKAMAHAAMKGVVADLRGRGYLPQAAGILQASGRLGKTLEATLASHALIHTADGEHFREALAQASERCGLGVVRVPERELVERAAAALRTSAQELRERVTTLGRPLGAPWGADQKSAALLAWLVLSGATVRKS